MLTKIESKIDEIIESIIAKRPEDVTYGEYKILDCRAKDLKYLEEQKKKNEEMAGMMAKVFSGFGSTNSYLPEPEIKEA